MRGAGGKALAPRVWVALGLALSLPACMPPPRAVPERGAPAAPDEPSLRAFAEIYGRVLNGYLFTLDPAWVLANAEAGLRDEAPRRFSLAEAMQGKPPVVMPIRDAPLDLAALQRFTTALRLRQEQTGATEAQLLEKALRAMLAGLDPKSSYLPPEEFHDLSRNARGSAAVGLEITWVGERACLRPLPDTPAAAAGLRAGDALISIDGEPVSGQPLPEIVRRLRGELDSPVAVRVRRGEQILDFPLRRRLIDQPGASVEPLTDGLLHLRVGTSIASDAATRVRRLIQMQAGPVRGLIVDLRGNTGGVLDQSVQLADLFLDHGSIGHLLERDRSRDFPADPLALLPGVPMVVLVDQKTAAGAELVAAALQAHGRALVLGEKTYGFGSVQTILPLVNNGAIKLTTGLLYQDYQQPIEGRGVIPDQSLTPPEPLGESCPPATAQGLPGETDPWQEAAMARLKSLSAKRP